MNVHASMEVIRRALGGLGFYKRQWQPLHLEHALAAADALEDAEEAIDAFASDAKGGGDVGVAYLKLYGVLQAAVLQQDAVNVLRVAFGFARTVQRDLPQGMQAIRDIRNRVGGHPADPWGQPGKAPPPATMVARHSIGKGTLSITYLEADFAIRHETVDFDVALTAHRQAVQAWLAEVAEKVRRDEQVFRDEARRPGKLADLVHPSSSWLIGKLHEASLSPVEKGISANVECSILRDTISKVEQGLADRSLGHLRVADYRLLREALSRLESLHQGGSRAGSEDLWRLDLLAYTQLVDTRFTEMVEALKNYDKNLEEPA